MFYLCFYIWMTQNTEREAGGGRGDEYRWLLCGPRSRGEVGGQNGACHSNVHHVFSQWGRRDNAGDSWWQRQLVVPLATACDPLWGDTSPHKKKSEVGGKKTSLTNQNSRPDTLPEPTADQCHEDGLAGMSDNTFSVTAPHYSSFLLPFALPRVFTHQRRGTGGCRLNQVTFPLFHFFHPKFEYEKGLSLTQSKTITLMTFGSHLIY